MNSEEKQQLQDWLAPIKHLSRKTLAAEVEVLQESPFPMDRHRAAYLAKFIAAYPEDPQARGTEVGQEVPMVDHPAVRHYHEQGGYEALKQTGSETRAAGLWDAARLIAQGTHVAYWEQLYWKRWKDNEYGI